MASVREMFGPHAGHLNEGLEQTPVDAIRTLDRTVEVQGVDFQPGDDYGELNDKAMESEENVADVRNGEDNVA